MRNCGRNICLRVAAIMQSDKKDEKRVKIYAVTPIDREIHSFLEICINPQISKTI